ncbi:MAG: RNA polymerase sigma factor [Deltaproteobacteria bacterium]|jgi:RNA polymerase sigma-70 factor (ECF subfamily)|nr:RNA polymerase sigma factor [Deltaproteobacteria bacterium]
MKEVSALVKKIQQGDRQACETLVSQYFGSCYAISLSIVKQVEDAEDVAQESLVKAIEKIEQLRNINRFESWLFQIVRNRSLNRYKKLKKRHHREVSIWRSSPAKKKENIYLRDSLLKALATLDEKQRTVVLLHELEGWSHEQIAKQLEISKVMSRQILFVSRKKLQDELGE